MKLTTAAMRAMLLAAQGLLVPPEQPARKEDLLTAIRRMGTLQIDTINIVARSPYLVLWSRLGSYPLPWLDELLADGALFEYWSHAACFLPIEDYGLYRQRMLAQRDEPDSSYRWVRANPELTDRVLAQVRADGEARSSSFIRADGRAGSWGDYKPEKVALECLFNLGHLMIARREQFQRVYALHERVLPSWNDAATPSAAEVQRALAIKAVRALGATPARWVADYFRQQKRGMADLLAAIARDGVLHPVEVDGWNEPAYVHPDHLPLLDAAAAGALMPSVTTLLSPFDPIVWDRARALELFGFHYRIEVYTPAHRRTYGYFSLPILYRGQLVGRLDPKAHRAEGRFEIKGLHLEPGVLIDADLVAELAGAIRRCAEWHSTPNVVIRQSDPPEFAELLRAQLA